MPPRLETAFQNMTTNSGASAVPPLLYKYCTAGTAIKVLEAGRLRWSSPLLFNDLSEFQRMPRLDPTIRRATQELPSILIGAAFGDLQLEEDRMQPVSKALLGMLRHARASGAEREQLLKDLHHDVPSADQQLEDALRSVFDKFGLETARVLCMTTSFDNETMWANYAGGHSGCVLGFRHLPEHDTPLMAARRIEYLDHQPVVGSGRDFVLYGDTAELRRNTLNAICYTKKLSWAYENEWRAMAWRPAEVGKQSGDYLFHDGELESVTIGPRISTDDEERINALLSRYARCSLYRFSVNRGTPDRKLEVVARS